MTARNSNIELARIVSMVAIVIYHFVCHGIYSNSWPLGPDFPLSPQDKLISYTTAFLMFGTDLFAMISGFFRIKLRWKTLINLWFLCAFYNILRILVIADFSISSILRCFFISQTQQWYFQAYLWIVLLSPLINAGINTLNAASLRLTCAFCFCLCGVSGWFLESVNVNGHSMIQLLCMYIIGAGLQREISTINRAKSYWYLMVFICANISNILFITLYSKRGLQMLFHHNNPFVMLSAMSALCFFSSLSIKNNIVNKIAASTPAVLLLSDTVFDNPLYSYIHNTFEQDGGFCATFISKELLILLGIFGTAYLIDYIRKIALNTLSNRFSDYLERKYPIHVP